MDGIFEFLFYEYKIFLIVLVRITGIFVISPFFSSQNIPNPVKIGFSLLLSLIISMSMDINIDSLNLSFFVIVAKELTVGLIIGFISYMFFATFHIMGQLIDMKIGFGMVNVMDPQHRVQVPLMGNFYYILAFLLLFSLDGHHIIIRSVVDSYNFLPIGKFSMEETTAHFLINILSETFVTGFKLAMPIIGIILLIDLLLGFLARTIPQMNVFVVGMPFKIFIGLIIIALGIPLFFSTTNTVFNGIVEQTYKFLKSFVKG